MNRLKVDRGPRHRAPARSTRRSRGNAEPDPHRPQAARRDPARRARASTIYGNDVSWLGWHFRSASPRARASSCTRSATSTTAPFGRSSTASRSTRSTCPTRSRTRTGRGGLRSTSASTTLGQYGESLEPASTCPTTPSSSTRSSPNDTASPATRRTTCRTRSAMYERDAGSLWDRTDPTTFERDARFARELVVTAAYRDRQLHLHDDYVFRLDGGIDVRAGATGTTLNRGVRSTADGEKFGTTVADEHRRADPPALLQLPDRLRRRRHREPARRGERAARAEPPATRS